MITDTFVADLKFAFDAFGIDEPIEQRGSLILHAGEMTFNFPAEGGNEIAICAHGAEVVRLSKSLRRTAIIAAVEWHQNNPRQGSLPLVAAETVVSAAEG